VGYLRRKKGAEDKDDVFFTILPHVERLYTIRVSTNFSVRIKRSVYNLTYILNAWATF
jgi:hypothetical protein